MEPDGMEPRDMKTKGIMVYIVKPFYGKSVEGYDFML